MILFLFTLQQQKHLLQALTISNISIQEKQEYLTPVYATDMWGNAHKVLRVAADQTISDD